MPDLETQLRAYGDALDAQLAEPPDVEPPDHRRAAVLVGAALVVLVAVVAAIVVARSSDDTGNVVVDQPDTTTTIPQRPTRPLEGVWRASTTPDWADSIVPVVVWTGTEMLVADRSGTVKGLDVATLEVRDVASVPLLQASGVWTGTEFLLVGWNSETRNRVEVVRIDPATGRIDTTIPPQTFNAEGSPSVRAQSAVWDGTNLILWSETEGRLRPLLFSPADNQWREGAVSDLVTRSFFVAMAVGSRVVVWGGCASPGGAGQCDEALTGTDELDDGATYDPATDIWTPLERSPVRGDHPAAVWTGEQLIVLVGTPTDDSRSNAAALDPSTGMWAILGRSPLSPRRYVTGSLVDGRAFFFGGDPSGGGAYADSAYADSAVYDPAANAWLRPPDAPEGRERHAAASTGNEVVIIGGCVTGVCESNSSGPLVFTPTTTAPPGTAAAPPYPTTPPENALTGPTSDGSTWFVWYDDAYGLCVATDTIALGCDLSATVSAWTRFEPRLAADPNIGEPGYGFVAYGYLPPGATDVAFEEDGGRRSSVGLRFDLADNIWAMPVAGNVRPVALAYMNRDVEVSRFALGVETP